MSYSTLVPEVSAGGFLPYLTLQFGRVDGRRGWRSHVPQDLNSLMELRRVVDFQLVLLYMCFRT